MAVSLECAIRSSATTHDDSAPLFTQRVCCTWQSAMPGQHLRVLEQAQSNISPRKIVVTYKSPVGDISAVTLIRTDTTLDHSQKAEKVYIALFTRVSELRDSRSWPCVPNNPKAAMTKTKELVLTRASSFKLGCG